MPSVQSHQAESIKSFWSDETKIDIDIQENNDQHETTNIFTSLSSSSLSSSSPSTNRCQIIKKICRRSTESYKEFIKRASSEYCITSVLSHTNAISAKDMIMKEYHFELVLNLEDPGISLYNLIHSIFLSHQQMVNYMDQLFQSIQYIHSIGIAHRDINLNNILIMQNDHHHTLKLSNFSSADVFQHPYQKKKKQSCGKVGLIEYQSPETLYYHHHHINNRNKKSSLSSSSSSNQHQQENGLHQYWATSLDIWSCGIVLFYLWKKKFPWSFSCPLHDNQFRLFFQTYSLNDDNNNNIISSLQHLSIIPRQLIYKMLNPDPATRVSIDQLLNEYNLLIL